MRVRSSCSLVIIDDDNDDVMRMRMTMTTTMMISKVIICVSYSTSCDTVLLQLLTFHVKSDEETTRCCI